MNRGVSALMLSLLAATAGAADDARLSASRVIAADFQSTLGSRLKAALAAGGTPAAIEVCAREAPVIAARISASSGAEVSRRGTRARNPVNVADADDRRVLGDFAPSTVDGQAAPIEFFEATADGGARYYTAIIIQPLCLACHGSALAPETVAALTHHYPLDQATGYAVGDLRGLLRVDWPAGSTEITP